MSEPLVTGNTLLYALAARRMLCRFLGPGTKCLDAGATLLTTTPRPGEVARLALWRASDVLAWYAAVSRGPTWSGQTTEECMREWAEELLPPF